MPRDAIILGAGVAGLSTAVFLQREGWKVTLLDPLGPAGGASFGNAGLLSPDTVIPAAMPGMWRKVPGWLRDPLGPLTIRPAYLPKLSPWLARWLGETRLARVEANAAALHALHAPALEVWRELLGETGFRGLMRQSGQVQLWEGSGGPGALETTLRARHGIRAEALGPDDLRQLFPGISREVTRGLLVPGNGHTVSPARAVHSLAEQVLAEGGVILPQKALKLIPREGGGWSVLANTGMHAAEALVVAGGAWSAELLAPLGIRLPLETERGYHAHLPNPSIELRVPILHKSRGFGLTPMEDGLRAAGTVEFAGLRAPPDERRAAQLAQQAKRLFPDLEFGAPRFWFGQRPSFPDSLPVVGGVPGRPGLYLCFGHGHFGMTGGPPSGRMLAGAMAGRGMPAMDALSPTRFSGAVIA
ncbi:FAD-binding oxidoreductase [Sediminicoccus sp. KRV36]|uniref:NAD(P)/FAD-dependent oxidoreductase n=1 Tax=Sediminicoccus sp. KRV36 TaxID=3133721 RepID=UPI00200F3FF2|nr:FAD-binding oxidoreductase [Sediminicoccus rosea]UPY38784.1 FAD-binding oxidoreductase [Sediminicoccus rosea]